MTSRRIISTENTILDQDDHVDTSPTSAGAAAASQQSDIKPAVPLDVILKLLAFTFAMIVVPIGSYFATVHTVFAGNSTFAGATAAIMANVVLIGYVVVAMKEDQSDQAEAKEGKKDR